MKRITRWGLSLMACTGMAAAGAAELRIGVMTTLSGAQAVPGVDMRDGIELAVKQLSGKVGGQPTRLIVADDQFNPGAAKQIAERLVKKDKVQVLTGIIYSNILLAAAPVALENGNVYLSSNAGPSQYAGAQCDSGFFSVSWQNDAVHEAAGKYAQDKEFKRVMLVAPNYPAGRDATTGFKRFFKGEVVEELYPKLGQLDFAVEIARLREQRADAVYFFLPGGMGINFIKQYRAAGIPDKTRLLTSQFSADQDTFAASGDAMLGIYNTGHWSTDTDTVPSREFVAGFEKAYGRLPSFYASQGYDAIMMIDAAVRAAGGNADDPKALRKALSESRFKSVRGKFSLGPNRFPVQDFFVRVVSRDPKGRLYNKTESLVLGEHTDAYGAACKHK
ncbi:ABC transporter substrate-binding protein [Verminephrobacter eiseniae]|uniref:Extracellular ligand-binding receptor n=1 Tax=Verminephrobacter eiseniae (strain EF01-2) TaxID=391735 RepID=A1WRQ1_VEREI|nr:ABC transporter substrate-binding protein [Verminephrobacter eiseniae]ABM60308.1 Extracellular ligand-binding receptor [Verminephrobacter eiseniae EF01-2]MCW5285793.1 ABC transporter substrate-binding protein [Verminephrobacter eiseniae]MCW5304091.1 ABC transporter substrate-binding protein [Verminephrobacter eiseniae]MCW8181108.1 ABC transporter substrate-binding protein [Verminephrobacter eiseniae]MCW8189712.1 ABC transporter substrate-binding protein [Verminephrobacter eiseniae]